MFVFQGHVILPKDNDKITVTIPFDGSKVTVENVFGPAEIFTFENGRQKTFDQVKKWAIVKIDGKKINDLKNNPRVNIDAKTKVVLEVRLF